MRECDTESDLKYGSMPMFILILAIAIALYFGILLAKAGTFTVVSNTVSRQATGALSSHLVRVTLSGGNTWAAGETLIIDFGEDENHFLVDGALTTVADFDLVVNKASTATEANVVSVCGSGLNDVSVSVNDSTGIVTFTACASFTSTDAGSEIVIEYGSNAQYGGSGTDRVTNPTGAGVHPILLAGTIGDTGSIYIPAISLDSIAIDATILPTMSFDIDTALTDTESAPPYTLDLGTLTSNAVTTSGVGGVNNIWIDFATNGTGGGTVTVQSQNAALVGENNPTNTIISGTDSLIAGTEGYGVCVETATQAERGPFVALSPFNGACTDVVHSVGGVTAQKRDILNTSGTTVADGRAKIRVKVAISGITAPDTYSDTLSFTANSTY